MKKLLAIFIILCLSGTSFAGSALTGTRFGEDEVPQPRLISPARDVIDLSGKDELVFKWSPHERARGFRDYYDFRLYKGYDMLAGSLIMKRQVDPNAYELRLPSNTFENGSTYTWSLRQVYDATRKSRRSYQSFKVIKK